MRTESEIKQAVEKLNEQDHAEIDIFDMGFRAGLTWVLNGKQVGNVPKADSAQPQLYEVEAVRERLASYAHKQWSGWMEYLFSKCVNPIEPDGTAIIPKWAVKRWKGQIETPYEELSEPEKESDRKEADGMIEIISRNFI